MQLRRRPGWPVDENLCFSPPALGHLAVDVERRGGCGRPGELARPAEPHIAQPVAVRCHPGHQGLGYGGGIGGIAAPPAISGIELTCEVTTGVEELDIDTRARNALLRSVRCLGERGFALLSQRWRTLQHVTASPGRIGLIARAALVLVLFEHKMLT